MFLQIFFSERTQQHAHDDAEPVTGRPRIHPVQPSLHDGGQPVYRVDRGSLHLPLPPHLRDDHHVCQRVDTCGAVG